MMFAHGFGCDQIMWRSVAPAFEHDFRIVLCRIDPAIARQFARVAFAVKALVAHLGVSRQGLSNLLNGHGGLSADMAARFEKAFGGESCRSNYRSGTAGLFQS